MANLSNTTKSALGVFAIVLIGAIYWVSGQSGNQTQLPQLIGAANAQEVDPLPDMILGDPDAPVEVIEYASFTCPHCARFHTDVYPSLKAEYIDTGKVKFVFREIYFDKFGLWAGMIARCGGDQKYFGIVDLLFKKQSEWARGNDAAEIAGNMYAIGRQAGMENDAMAACLQDSDSAKALVADFQLKAGADEIESTPTFIVNGEKMSNMSLADFREVLDARLN